MIFSVLLFTDVAGYEYQRKIVRMNVYIKNFIKSILTVIE